MFFHAWSDLAHIAIVGTLVYLALIAVLRVSGKRSLSKWNAFDFVVTIALGSTLASALLSKDVSLAEGVFALALLIGWQFVITWLSVRFTFLHRATKSSPTLLLQNGQLLEDALKKQRVTPGEVRAAVRAKGIAALEDVEAVVLETDGSFSVLRKLETPSRSALEDVAGYEKR
jgi:uncharacterized membrane protein YcaP (DUF421 family)